MQYCSSCKELKELNEFHVDTSTANKRRNTCKDCRSRHRKATRITKEEHNHLRKIHNNVCAICGIDSITLGKELSIDHNHETQKIRGLLCNSCNTGLGFFKDSTTLLSIAIEYLVTHDGIA